jgi:hypothetical protein
MGHGRTYTERLFDFPMVDALRPEFARLAVIKPLNAQAVDKTQEAIEQILEQTRGYPYFFSFGQAMPGWPQSFHPSIWHAFSEHQPLQLLHLMKVFLDFVSIV